MNISKIIRRFFIPTHLVTIYCLLKYGAKISPKAEVELSSNLKLGKKTQIGSFTKVKSSDGPLILGKNISVGTNCFISASEKGVSIGDDCLIGPGVCIVGNSYNYDDVNIPIYKQGKNSKGIKIGNNVWIGANVTILDGTTIEDGVIIGANSIVKDSLKKNCIAVAKGSLAVAVKERA